MNRTRGPKTKQGVNEPTREQGVHEKHSPPVEDSPPPAGNPGPDEEHAPPLSDTTPEPEDEKSRG